MVGHHRVLALQRKFAPRPCRPRRPARRRPSRRCGARSAAGSRPPPSDTCSRAPPGSCSRPPARRRRAARGRRRPWCRPRRGTCRRRCARLRTPRSRSSRSSSTHCFTLLENLVRSNGISGNRMMCGASPGLLPARPPAAAIQPACRPMTSSTNTLVEVRAIEARRAPPRASRPRCTWPPSRSRGSSR